MGVFLRDFEGLFVCLLLFFFSRIDRLQLPIWCYCHLPCLAGQSIILSILCGPFFFFFFVSFFFSSLINCHFVYMVYGITIMHTPLMKLGSRIFKISSPGSSWPPLVSSLNQPESRLFRPVGSTRLDSIGRGTKEPRQQETGQSDIAVNQIWR